MRRIVGLVAVLGASAWAPGVEAAPIVDQQQLSFGGQLNGGSSSFTWQQGVTAGLTGQLTQVDFYVHTTSGSTSFFLNLGAPWQADAHDWSVSNPTLAAGWNSFDLTGSGIFVSAGDQLSIGSHGLGGSFDPSIGYDSGTVSDPYTGGELWWARVAFPTNGPFPYAEYTGLGGNPDMAFRTYVDVQGGNDNGDPNGDPVPEPAMLLLLGTGLLGAGVTARRRRMR